MFQKPLPSHGKSLDLNWQRDHKDMYLGSHIQQYHNIIICSAIIRGKSISHGSINISSPSPVSPASIATAIWALSSKITLSSVNCERWNIALMEDSWLFIYFPQKPIITPFSKRRWLFYAGWMSGVGRTGSRRGLRHSCKSDLIISTVSKSAQFGLSSTFEKVELSHN